MSTEFNVYERIIVQWTSYYVQDTQPNAKGSFGYRHVKQPLTAKELDTSLHTNSLTIGVCTTESGSNLVRCPGFDVDNHEGTLNIIPDIKKIIDECVKRGYHPFIESSSGDDVNNGAHICFICKPTLAKTIRRELKSILVAVGLEHEINPKQDNVEPDKFGNQVKLIWQYHNRTKARSTIINPDTMKPFERQEAIDYLMALPDTIFIGKDEVETPQEEKIKAPAPNTEPIKATSQAGRTFDECFHLDNIKPCIKACFNEAWVLHGKGDAGHDFRIAAAGHLLYNGATDNQVHEYFMKQPDYVKTTTATQLKSIHQYLSENKKPMGCTKIAEKCRSLLNGMCEGCPNKPKEKRQKTNSVDVKIDSDEHIYTDMRNSKKLAELIKNTARYCYNWKCWIVHTGKIWEEDHSGYMMRMAREVSRQLQKDALEIEDLNKRREALGDALACESGARLRAMIDLCQSEEEMTIEDSVFDINPMLFNVQNGTIDLNTGELLKHNPKDFITKIAPISYNPKAECPRFLSFLGEVISYEGNDTNENNFVVHQKNVIAYLQRWAGYCLTGICREEQFLILYGDGGTGKSKFVGALGYVMGNYYDKIDIATIQESHKARDGSTCTPDLLALKGLRFIVASEPEKGLKLNEARIKDFTGRDAIHCRGLHQRPTTYNPEFKLGVYTNYQIIIKGQDNSIWRRVHQAGFRHPEAIDKNLDLKLRGEAEGILNWMIAGCLAWNKTGLDVPSEILEAVQEYKEDMDILSGYFELCCICDKKDKNLRDLGKDLFHVYKAWWRIEHEYDTTIFDKQFYQMLHERGFKKDKKHSRNGTFIYSVKLSSQVREAYESAISVCGGYNGEAVKHVRDFLLNFLPLPRMGKNTDNCFTSFTPSQKQPTAIIHENESTTVDTKTAEQKETVTELCGICGNPLNGSDHRFVGHGLGNIHKSCEYATIKVKALIDFTFISLNTHEPIQAKKDDIIDVPGLQALSIILKHGAERIEMGVV